MDTGEGAVHLELPLQPESHQQQQQLQRSWPEPVRQTVCCLKQNRRNKAVGPQKTVSDNELYPVRLEGCYDSIVTVS